MPRKCVDIRRQLGVDFSIVALEEGEEDSEFIKLIGGKTEWGIGREIEEYERRAKKFFAPNVFWD